MIFLAGGAIGSACQHSCLPHPERRLKMKLLKSLSCAVLGVLVLTLAGCGSSDFPVASVTGVVLCDGKPVPGALVFFEPQQEGDNAMVGKTGLGVANDLGEFSVRTYGSNDGAVVGKHKVKVERGSGPGCDCAMNADKTVVVLEVTADGENNFSIELPEKTRADAKAEKAAQDEDDEDEEDD